MSLFFIPSHHRLMIVTQHLLSQRSPTRPPPCQSHTDRSRESLLMINHETSRADKGRCGSCTIKAIYNYTYRLALTRVDVEWANVTCNIVICNILHNNKAHKKMYLLLWTSSYQGISFRINCSGSIL